MTVNEIMTELQAKGSDSIKKIWLNHGVKEPFFGVKIEHLKVIQKRIKTDYLLAMQLYATGNADAMYLAGLITDDKKMTKEDLTNWVKHAYSSNICDYTVPWVAAGSNYGYELGLEWIDNDESYIACAGWATLSNYIALKPDENLDIDLLKTLMDRVLQTIHTADDKVRSVMNNFIIAVGTYVKPLTEYAIYIANKIGVVKIVKSGTACNVPLAANYIQKAVDKGIVGKKKKTVKC